MTRPQRDILATGLIFVLLMGAIPPWTASRYTRPEVEQHLGYHPIWAPPEVSSGYANRINVALLALQWAGVCLVTGGLYVALRKPEQGP